MQKPLLALLWSLSGKGEWLRATSAEPRSGSVSVGEFELSLRALQQHQDSSPAAVVKTAQGAFPGHQVVLMAQDSILGFFQHTFQPVPLPLLP